MTLFRMTADRFEPVPVTTYAKEQLLERRDLQRLLRADTGPIGEDLLVIAEEFGDWEDSNRRIDLLCLSQGGDLVVVEIKRTEDGGHMELQALRYAAMVSAMSMEQVRAAYARAHGLEPASAADAIAEFLSRDVEDTATLTGVVRIVLVAADFSTELTTTVLWLRKREIDIRCVRLRPHRLAGELVVDASQIIPLPEAAEYEVKLRQQEEERRQVLTLREETFRRFWGQLIERARGRTTLLANRSSTSDPWISLGLGRSGLWLNASLTQQQGQVECFLRLPAGEAATEQLFQILLARRDEIERTFGASLDWDPMPGRKGCKVRRLYDGGWRSPESEWPAMQDRLIDGLVRMDAAIRPVLASLPA